MAVNWNAAYQYLCSKQDAVNQTVLEWNNAHPDMPVEVSLDNYPPKLIIMLHNLCTDGRGGLGWMEQERYRAGQICERLNRVCRGRYTGPRSDAEWQECKVWYFMYPYFDEFEA